MGSGRIRNLLFILSGYRLFSNSTRKLAAAVGSGGGGGASVAVSDASPGSEVFFFRRVRLVLWPLILSEKHRVVAVWIGESVKSNININFHWKRGTCLLHWSCDVGCGLMVLAEPSQKRSDFFNVVF